MTRAVARNVYHIDGRNRSALILLGFALGGFFDGILLHQILQWHHLLSGVGGLARNFAVQVLADGLFHAAMYVFAITGTVSLVRHRYRLAAMPTAWLSAFALIGFGLWHVTDAIAFHWVLGLHHVKMDAQLPLLWDVGWLAVFGGLPLALATFLLVQKPGLSSGKTSTTAKLLVVIVGVSGCVAAFAPSGQSPNLVVFLMPAAHASTALEIAKKIDATILTSSQGGRIWLMSGQTERSSFLGGQGAVIVPSTRLLAGCIATLAIR